VQKKKKTNIGYVNELRIFRAEKSRVYEHSYGIMFSKKGRPRKYTTDKAFSCVCKIDGVKIVTKLLIFFK
jgi:hypothetical protein